MKENITTTNNKLINDISISFKAKGLFYQLLSTYGKEFEITKLEILSLSKKDKSISIYSAIKELESKGFLKRVYFGKVRKIKIILTLQN
jgi:uncharacterized protein YebE (UPF0316 family)